MWRRRQAQVLQLGMLAMFHCNNMPTGNMVCFGHLRITTIAVQWETSRIKPSPL